MTKVVVFRIENGLIGNPTLGDSDGTSIRVEKWREEFIIVAPPKNYNRPVKGFGIKRSYLAYFCDATAAVTVNMPQESAKWFAKKEKPFTLRGVTVTPPQLEPSVEEVTQADGTKVNYRITAAHIYERSDSSDLKRFNDIAKRNWLEIILAMCAGGGIFLLLALGLMAFGKLHLGGSA